MVTTIEGVNNTIEFSYQEKDINSDLIEITVIDKEGKRSTVEFKFIELMPTLEALMAHKTELTMKEQASLEREK